MTPVTYFATSKSSVFAEITEIGGGGAVSSMGRCFVVRSLASSVISAATTASATTRSTLCIASSVGFSRIVRTAMTMITFYRFLNRFVFIVHCRFVFDERKTYFLNG